MSPGYQRSAWCQRELGNFLASASTRDSLEALAFIIEMEPVERQSWHPALRVLKSTRFWERRSQDIAPRLLGYPKPKLDEDSPYWQSLNELAHELAKRLSCGEAGEREARPAVWIAEPTEDLLEERDGIANALRQHGVDVVPVAPYPRESKLAYLEALGGDVAKAALLVQLLGPREGYRPSWSEQSFVALQAQEAGLAGQRRNIPLLRWRPREVDPDRVATAVYRELLLGVETSGIEDFKQEVLGYLKPVVSAPAVARPWPLARAQAQGDVPYVYIDADPVDRDLALRVQDSLVALGVDAVLTPEPSPDQLPEQNRRAQQEGLQACDAVVIVYGRTPPTWVHAQFAFSRRLLAQRRRGVWGALLDGPPQEKPDVGLKSPSLLLLNCRGGLDAGALAGFVETLRA